VLLQQSFVQKKAERKRELDSRCRLTAESGGTSSSRREPMQEEQTDERTNGAARSDAGDDVDSIERAV
jgi:hypothetical protein